MEGRGIVTRRKSRVTQFHTHTHIIWTQEHPEIILEKDMRIERREFGNLRKGKKKDFLLFCCWRKVSVKGLGRGRDSRIRNGKSSAPMIDFL